MTHRKTGKGDDKNEGEEQGKPKEGAVEERKEEGNGGTGKQKAHWTDGRTGRRKKEKERERERERESWANERPPKAEAKKRQTARRRRRAASRRLLASEAGRVVPATATAVLAPVPNTCRSTAITTQPDPSTTTSTTIKTTNRTNDETHN